MKKYINIFFSVSCLAIFGLMQGCGRSNSSCDDCETIRPTEGYIITLVNKKYLPLPVEVFKGKFGEGASYFRDTIWRERDTFVVPTKQYYSVAVRYLRGRDTVLVVDGDKVTYGTYFDSCGTKCYDYKDPELDLLLEN